MSLGVSESLKESPRVQFCENIPGFWNPCSGNLDPQYSVVFLQFFQTITHSLSSCWQLKSVAAVSLFSNFIGQTAAHSISCFDIGKSCELSDLLTLPSPSRLHSTFGLAADTLGSWNFCFLLTHLSYHMWQHIKKTKLYISVIYNWDWMWLSGGRGLDGLRYVISSRLTQLVACTRKQIWSKILSSLTEIPNVHFGFEAKKDWF